MGGDVRRRNEKPANKEEPASGESNRQRKKNSQKGRSVSEQIIKFLRYLLLGAVGVAVVGAAVFFALKESVEPEPEPDTILGAISHNGGIVQVAERTIKMPNGEEMQGIVATKDLGVADNFMVIPMTNLLHPGVVHPGVHAACKGECHEAVVLVLGLVMEARSPRPLLEPWIKSLPKVVDNVVNFLPEQMNVLDIRAEKPYSLGVHKVLEAAAQTAKKVAGLTTPITESEVRWAFSIYMSRAATVKIGGSMTQAYIPGYDSMNHAPLANFSALAPKCERDYCTVIVLRAIKKGEQVFSNYGELSNIELLTKYGFTIENNTIGPKIDVKPNDGEIKKSVWLIHPKAEFGCSRPAQLEGPLLHTLADDDTTGFVKDADMKCLFLAEAFKYEEEAKLALLSKPDDWISKCLHTTDPYQCLGGPNKTDGVEYIEAAGRAHYAAKNSCFNNAVRVHNISEALGKLFSLDDAVSEQLREGVGREVRMLIGCMSYHGGRLTNLSDMATEHEFGQ